MQKEVVIIGAGGHAKVIADIIKKSGDVVVGFLDDNIDIQGKIIFDNKKVLGTTKEECIDKYKDKFFVIAIGSNKVRELLSNKYHYLNWYTAIHPNSVISTDVLIGEGTVVMAGAIINAGTQIGKHCIINTSVSVDHDNHIEDFVHISPGTHIAGTVSVGKNSWICTGATIINNIKVEENIIVGAGAVVINDLNEKNTTYIGIPAIKK